MKDFTTLWKLPTKYGQMLRLKLGSMLKITSFSTKKSHTKTTKSTRKERPLTSI